MGALDADWLAISRRAAQRIGELLDATPATADRVRETGAIGEGGDRTLVIDAQAEQIVFDELDALAGDGVRFTAVSEERGIVDYGDPGVLVVIDPIDGSLNAKRGVPSHAVSIAVADGPTMADVRFGFIRDFGAGESFHAVSGDGAFLDGERLPTEVAERRHPDGRLEIVGIEAAEPRWVANSIDALLATAYRLRGVGAIALTLCHVAAGRFDGMVTLKRSRAVDSAAGQLIVREAGGHVRFRGFDPPLSAPLDLVPHAPLIAARTLRGLDDLTPVPG